MKVATTALELKMQEGLREHAEELLAAETEKTVRPRTILNPRMHRFDSSLIRACQCVRVTTVSPGRGSGEVQVCDEEVRGAAQRM